MTGYWNLRRIASILLLIGIIGCTAKQSKNTIPQAAKALDSLAIPEQIRDLDNLTALDPSQPPQYEISFTPKEIYGEIYLNRVMMAHGHNWNTVSIDRNGQVYIMDRIEKSIHVYKPDGELLSKIGGEGRGPGEFLFMSTIRMDGDRLMTYGATLKRIQWFDLDSHDVNVLNLNPEELIIDQGELILESITAVMPLGNGRILIGGLSHADTRKKIYGIIERINVRYYLLDENGNLISEELFQSAVEKSSQMVLKENTSSDEGIVTVSPEGIIYRANTAQFLIHAIDIKDSTRHSIYYPYENAPVDRDKLLEGYSDNLRARMQDVEFEDHFPALHSIIADDENRLWVSTITEDADTHTWWVLKDSGELLGKFDWPRSEEIETIRNGSMYVREKDLENGVLTVHRYEIQMDPI